MKYSIRFELEYSQREFIVDGEMPDCASTRCADHKAVLLPGIKYS